ncbi:hypothetical protein DFH28DRAFT_946253 [Melampsora americana]|nr:hypothetical protein DFH28DRAFT_946253 [Melampsora americana]
MLSRAMRGSDNRSCGHRDIDQVVIPGIQNAPPSCDSTPSNEPSSFCFQFENRSPAESQPDSASSLGEEPPSPSHSDHEVNPSPIQWYVPILFGWDKEWTETRWIEFVGKKDVPQPDKLHVIEETSTGYSIPIPIDQHSGMEKAIKEESHKKFIIESCYKSASRSSTYGLKY